MVDLPIDSIIGSSINTIFMKHTIWKRQDIHWVWISSLVNKSSPVFSQHGHLGFGNLNRNCVDRTWGCSIWNLHPSACVIEHTFDSGILWNVCNSQHGVGLNSRRGIRDCESDIPEYWIGIIHFLRLDLYLGWCGLQGLEFEIILSPVLVLARLIYLSRLTHFLLPALTPKILR